MNRNDIAYLMNPRSLQLIILPTEQCNFRCTYCYEDFSIGRMEQGTVNAIKALISKRAANLDFLSISWFGGEPLLAKDIITEIGEHAQAIANSSHMIFASNITTNGYTLNRGTFAAMLKAGVSHYQISLDGDAPEHDKTRTMSTGHGSFETIWKNILALRERVEDFSILLRVHVHTDNYESVKVLLGRINAALQDDIRFSIYLRAVSNWGGEGVKSLSLMTDPQRLDALQTHLTELGWYVPRQAVPVPLNETAGPQAELARLDAGRARPGPGAPRPGVHACYAALPNSLVIRANGQVAKCTVAFNDERNNVGVLNDDGTLTLKNERMHGFMRGFKNLSEDDLKCPMHGMPSQAATHVLHFEKNAARQHAEA